LKVKISFLLLLVGFAGSFILYPLLSRKGVKSTLDSGQGSVSQNTWSQPVADESNSETFEVGPIQSSSTISADYSELLAKYQTTGDKKWLEAAIASHSTEPAVIIVSAIVNSAKSTNSWIDKLERLQPRNALPNLLKARLFAADNDLQNARKELEIALSKPDLDLATRSRKAAIIDLLLADSSHNIQKAFGSHPDWKFITGTINPLSRLLRDKPEVFGGKENAAGLGLALAGKLRQLNGNERITSVTSNSIELGLLLRLSPDIVVDQHGLTVGQRISQINSEAAQVRRRSQLWNQVISPAVDINTQRSFLLRVRADGDLAALDWLEKQMANENRN
jgi:hypothetical protein